MNLQDTLASLDVDVAATLNRFSNMEPLLAKFVKKFPSDATYGQLLDALKQQDHQALEAASHTLKGVAANMGFARLSQRCDTLVKALRAGERGQEVLAQMTADISAEYDKIVQAIAGLD